MWRVSSTLVLMDGPFSNCSPKVVVPDYASCSSCWGLHGWGQSHSECMPPHPDSEGWLIIYNPPTVGCLVTVTGPFQFLAISFVSAVLVASSKLSGFLVSVRT